MGNCYSCCILEPYEISKEEHLYINKKETPIRQRKTTQTNLFYDSCVF